ncbi:hypothetical protein JCGZ_00080 [Jatropha curcas]|nr:hypothetical protein JCGZ_00080 [Jatropha curcas]
MPGLFGFEGDVNVRTLPRGRARRYSRRYSHTTSNIRVYRQLLNGLNRDRIERYPWGDAVDFLDLVQAAIGYQHRHLLLLGLFYDVYYLRERVYKWKLGPDRRRV